MNGGRARASSTGSLVVRKKYQKVYLILILPLLPLSLLAFVGNVMLGASSVYGSSDDKRLSSSRELVLSIGVYLLPLYAFFLALGFLWDYCSPEKCPSVRYNSRSLNDLGDSNMIPPSYEDAMTLHPIVNPENSIPYQSSDVVYPISANEIGDFMYTMSDSDLSDTESNSYVSQHIVDSSQIVDNTEPRRSMEGRVSLSVPRNSWCNDGSGSDVLHSYDSLSGTNDPIYCEIDEVNERFVSLAYEDTDDFVSTDLSRVRSQNCYGGVSVFYV